MGAIANFRKQREVARAELQKLSEKASAAVADLKRDKPADKKAAPVSEAKNEALTLLARLLGCEPEKAIEQAKELIETAEQDGFRYIISWEELEPEPEKVTAPAEKTDGAADTLQASAEAVQDAAANVDDAAGSVNAAADNVASAADSVSGAASDLDDTASKLAYSADDIGQATGELKKATEELKKPSAVRQSSRGARTAARKNSSKK